MNSRAIHSNLVSGGRRLRVAVIPARFDPGLNYQENVFAEALYELGHEVVVFVAGKHDQRGSDDALPFRIERDQSAFQLRATVFPFSRAFAGKIRAFAPQMAVILAPNHGPGAIWISALPEECVVVSCFSDLPWHRSWWVEFIKKRWARRVIARSSRVLAATGETAALVKSWVTPELAKRVTMSGLTFNPHTLDGGTLPVAALELRRQKARIITMVTRVTPDKRLGLLFGAIADFLRSRPDTGFIFAGLDSSEESRTLRVLIEKSDVANQCVLLSFLDGKSIGALFHAADISIWSLVSIGIYHSLHCGCRILLRQGQDAKHLLSSGAAGGSYTDETALPEKLSDIIDNPVSRAEVTGVVAPYIGTAMVAGIVEEFAGKR